MAISTKRKLLYLVILSGMFILFDQALKVFLIAYLKQQPGHMARITPIISLVYSWNYGISFGLFSNYYQYSNYVFLVINSLIILYLSIVAIRSETIISLIAFSTIIGGALGNLADRIFRGAVFDFLYFHYNDFSFPAFNLADSFITAGAIMLLFEYSYTKSNR
jgi:signal peptidase II